MRTPQQCHGQHSIGPACNRASGQNAGWVEWVVFTFVVVVQNIEIVSADAAERAKSNKEEVVKLMARRRLRITNGGIARLPICGTRTSHDAAQYVCV